MKKGYIFIFFFIISIGIYFPVQASDITKDWYIGSSKIAVHDDNTYLVLENILGDYFKVESGTYTYDEQNDILTATVVVDDVLGSGLGDGTGIPFSYEVVTLTENTLVIRSTDEQEDISLTTSPSSSPAKTFADPFSDNTINDTYWEIEGSGTIVEQNAVLNMGLTGLATDAYAELALSPKGYKEIQVDMKIMQGNGIGNGALKWSPYGEQRMAIELIYNNGQVYTNVHGWQVEYPSWDSGIELFNIRQDVAKLDTYYTLKMTWDGSQVDFFFDNVLKYSYTPDPIHIVTEYTHTIGIGLWADSNSQIDAIADNFSGDSGLTIGTPYYHDYDGDGYGDPNDTILSIATPERYVEDNLDCDDTDASIHPGAQEVSNDGIDQNCNGIIDDTLSILPGKVVLTSPSGSTEEINPTFKWNEDPYSTWYKLFLWDSSEKTVYTNWYESSAICIGGSCSVSIGLELPVGEYEWFVKSWNSYGSIWSDGMTFNTSSPPSKVTQTSPSGLLSSSVSNFTWVSDPASTWYRLWVGYSDDQKISAKWYEANDICSAGTCSVLFETELMDGDYKWYIKSWNSYGKAWSDGMSFTIATDSTDEQSNAIEGIYDFTLTMNDDPIGGWRYPEKNGIWIESQMTVTVSGDMVTVKIGNTDWLPEFSGELINSRLPFSITSAETNGSTSGGTCLVKTILMGTLTFKDNQIVSDDIVGQVNYIDCGENLDGTNDTRKMRLEAQKQSDDD